MPQSRETIGECAAAGDGDAAEMSRRGDENSEAQCDHHRLVVQAENPQDQHRDVPDADADAEAEHGALCGKQRRPLGRRRDESHDRRAGGVDQPRKNSDEEDAHGVVGGGDCAGVEVMPVIEIDAVEPQHYADETAEERGNSQQFRRRKSSHGGGDS